MKKNNHPLIQDANERLLVVIIITEHKKKKFWIQTETLMILGQAHLIFSLIKNNLLDVPLLSNSNFEEALFPAFYQL